MFRYACSVSHTSYSGGSRGTRCGTGAEVTIYSVVTEHSIAKHFSVTFCGDGTHVACRAGMCLMSSPGVRMYKAAFHHAVSMVKGQESYTSYNTSFQNVSNSINALATSTCLEINDKEIAINVFLLMVVGNTRHGWCNIQPCLYVRQDPLKRPRGHSQTRKHVLGCCKVNEWYF